MERSRSLPHVVTMVEKTEDQRPPWRRVAGWLGTKIAEHVLGWLLSLFSVALLIGWRVEILAFLGSQRVIKGWQLAVLGAALLLFGAATVVIALYARRLNRGHAAALAEIVRKSALKPPAPFKPIIAHDRRLNIEWTIRQRPELWLGYQDVEHRLAPAAILDILDGPFHSECHERLEDRAPGYGRGHASPLLMEHCPGCGKHLFRVPPRAGETMFVPIWVARAQAVAELQRMYRAGMPIEGSWIELQQPKYWRDMAPFGA
jgi:hypothetical protein